MTRIERYRSWFEEAIAFDLASYDMLECKPISQRRGTAHLTRVLWHDAVTEEDTANTITMPTEIGQSR